MADVEFKADVAADAAAIANATLRTTDFLERSGVDARAVHHVVLVLEEILTNLTTHGGAPAEAARVRITVEPARVVGEIIDAGAPFDPRGALMPDVEASMNDRLVGGLGLFLVNQLTSAMEYARQNGRNRLVFSVARTATDVHETVDMKITEEPHGRVLLVAASGRLDGNTSQEFTARLEPLISRAEPRLVLDMSGIEFVSSAGLRAVLALFRKIKAAKGAFALCAVQPPVLEVLDISGFMNLIQIHPGRDGALAALA
jgi:anti-anti-sigma factor